ncbi:hypothetical protein ACFVXG_17540 [Kitasatospora sp. NPDC058162]|uniref:hypothetical protein n=1 Tax=Kitasatospora sp. NPDC058162 TaxID=3346362 RepID=UPI0036D9CC8F
MGLPVDAGTGAPARPADRFPHIALSLGQWRVDEAYWAVERVRTGVPLAEMDHAELLSTAESALKHAESLVLLLEAVELAIPIDWPKTLDRVITPIREYLKWTLDAHRPYAGSAEYVGEVKRVGGWPSVRVRVELEVVEGAPNGSATKRNARRREKA